MNKSEPVYEVESFRKWTCGTILKKHWSSLALVQLFPREKSEKNQITKKLYGIIFEHQTERGIVLFKNERLNDVTNKFDCLVNILDTIPHPTAMPKATLAKIRVLLRKLMFTMDQHPNWTEIHICAYHGYGQYFKKQKFTKEEISLQKSPDYYTPLHLAIMGGWTNVVERILSLQPNYQLVDHEKNNVIHTSVMTSSVEILKVLLQRIPNVRELFRQVNSKNLTPISLACTTSKPFHLMQLMRFGLTVRMLTIVNDPKFLTQLDDKTLLMFNDPDLDILDFSQIKYGGCPLHWSTKSIGIRQLIEFFNPKTINLNGDTPVMSMVKNNHFNAALCLMIYGCDVNLPDLNGDTPLHVAVQRKHDLLIKSLIIFDANVDTVNANGQDPYTIAKNLDPSLNREILHVFKTYYETLKMSERVFEPSTSSGSSASFPNDTNDIGSEYDLSKFRYDIDKICSKQKKSGKNQEKISRILNFDGGGVRGLFTVQIMIELQRYLKRYIASYFDWIGGTSTGSMIAYSICREMPLSEIRRLYFIFKDEILDGTKPYSSEKLENLFKTLMKGDIPMKEVLQKNKKHLVITAVRVDRHPPTLHLFCSHNYSKSSSSEIPVWQALRASCAAPTYFQHFTTFTTFVDGGLISNNPTIDVLTEFFRFQMAAKKNTDGGGSCRLGTVVSLGTGTAILPKQNMSHIFDKFSYFMDFRSCLRDLAWATGAEVGSEMKLQITNTGKHIVQRAGSWCTSLDIPFFRFNPIFSKRIALDESGDEELVTGLWEVKLYCLRLTYYFKKLADILEEPW